MTIMEELEKLSDDVEVNALGREELIKAEHEFGFAVGYVMGIRKAMELIEENEDDEE